MCGRFTLTTEESAIRAAFGVPNGSLTWQPQFNIAPSQAVLAVIADGAERRLGRLTWGLVPPWSPGPKSSYATFNARSETLLQQRTWKRLMPKRRCLVPADGYFEWDRTTRQPHRIHLTDRPLFAFAGLWDTWVAKDGSQRVDSCTIITCAASPSLAALHDRMPVILPPHAEAIWLNPAVTEPEPLLSLLQPYPDSTLHAYPVGRAVGNVRHEGPDCIAPIAEA